MAPTSAFCRVQEAFHRDRAAGAMLDNVRTIANSAAAAWKREAMLAEHREDNRRPVATLPEAGSLSEEAEDRWASENPDRGHAGAQ